MDLKQRTDTANLLHQTKVDASKYNVSIFCFNLGKIIFIPDAITSTSMALAKETAVPYGMVLPGAMS